jgi:hypothetical protein
MSSLRVISHKYWCTIEVEMEEFIFNKHAILYSFIFIPFFFVDVACINNLQLLLLFFFN